MCPTIAPAWFESIATNTWIEIAGGAGFGASYQNGARIENVAPSPLPPGNSGLTSVTDAWTGGCAYQNGKQLLLPAQGGHADYYGNEVYSLNLNQSVPGWQRIWGPTPIVQILTSNFSPSYNPPYTGYADGAPRSSHGWFSLICTSAGRIITTLQNANPSGTWDTGCYSLDINNVSDGWTYHGRLWQTLPGSPGSDFAYQSGPGGYDPVANRFYRAAEGANSKGAVGVDVATMLAAGAQSKTTGPQTPGSTIYDLYIPGGPLADGWSVVLDDMNPRCWVIGSHQEGNLWILDLTNPAAGFVKKSTTGSPNGFQPGLGAVYHKPSKAILVGGREIGRNLRKLSISGSNPLTATYSWSNISLGGATPVAGANANGTYSKFQMIDDMGNGQSAIVMATRVNGPSYVLKLPPVV